MKPICAVLCQREMAVHQTGVVVEYKNANGSGEKYFADLFRCPECANKVISGFGNGPIMRHDDAGYEALRPDFVVVERQHV